MAILELRDSTQIRLMTEKTNVNDPYDPISPLNGNFFVLVKSE